MKKVILVLLIVLGLGLMSTGVANACFLGFGSDCPVTTDATTQQANNQDIVVNNQSRMEIAVPLPKLEGSLERANISKRLQIFSDPSKVSYIYLVNYGRVMAFYTIKGKVTSGNKRLTPTQQQVEAQHWTSGMGTLAMEAPELDGTYGSSGNYIFFWTTDGVYVQWSGDYMLVDQPLQLTSQPELVRTVQ